MPNETAILKGTTRGTGVSEGWGKILDELRSKEGIVSDSALAESLGVSRAFISAIRKSMKNMPVELLEKIVSRLGRRLNQDELTLLTPLRIKRRTSVLMATKPSHQREKLISISRGKCELCGNDAPFKIPDGTPYLELHFVVPVADGGNNGIKNTVALCPNCHRKMEICPTDAETKFLLAKALAHTKINS